MIITIDGPAGAGKSTIAQKLAAKLNIAYLDTGALYRAVTYRALQAHCPFDNTQALIALAKDCDIAFKNKAVYLNGQDVSDAIRTTEVTKHIHHIAQNKAIRKLINLQQRAIGNAAGALLTEGRDQGSVVFTDAPYKFYLDAKSSERAQRRFDQMQTSQQRNQTDSYESILTAIEHRDHLDSSRAVDPLTVPKDAIIIDSTHMTIEQVVDKMYHTVKGNQ